MSSPPGLLYVTMQPEPGLAPAKFHEWYNNEHGPTRLKLPHIFSTGLRYEAIDGLEPKYVAAYDVTRMSELETETYTSLRANRSPREADTIAQVDVKRYFWDLVVAERKWKSFQPWHQVEDKDALGTFQLAIQLELKDEPDAEENVVRWYEGEHIEMLSQIRGWLRSRVFKTSSLESGAPKTLLALHEFGKQNELEGPAHRAARSTPWRSEIFDKYVTIKDRRIYKLFYVFGQGPRDLTSLSELPAAESHFTSADGRTTTSNDPHPVISSYVTTADGLDIPYRLEGNPDPKAPVIAFCNSLLTDLHMWDSFVSILLQNRPEFRILRYDHRGRHAIPYPPKPVTLEMLADDLAFLLYSLRIHHVDNLIGVSMGGATALKFAMRHPNQLVKFVACDFNAASSPANTQAWQSRIAVAETPAGPDGVPGIRKLAAATVERWFHPATWAARPPVVDRMIDMVAGNDVEGFRYGCQALWDYDMRRDMPACWVQGLFVAGEADGGGALVRAMDGFRGHLGENGANLVTVPGAGHLPMCEAPEQFWKAIEKGI